MSGEWRHTPASGTTRDRQHLHQNATARSEQARAGKGGAPPAKARLAGAPAPAPARSAGSTTPRSYAQHLGYQPAHRTSLSVATRGFARPDAKLAILCHSDGLSGPKSAMVPQFALKMLAFFFRAARAPTDAPALAI